MKKFIIGFLTGALIFGSIAVGAVTYYKAEKANFKVLLNGSTFIASKPVVTIDGSTYLPLKDIGKALGVNVNWNSKLKQVEIGKSPTPSGDYSRTNPAPINTVQKVTIDTYSTKYTSSARVIETIRGDEAWQKIKTAWNYNNPAKEGYEYILAKIAVSMLSVDGNKAVDISKYNFDVFSKSNVEYDHCSVLTPEPTLSTSMYAGGNTEGYVVFEVKKDDTAPKIVFGKKYDGTGGIWFKLTK